LNNGSAQSSLRPRRKNIEHQISLELKTYGESVSNAITAGSLVVYQPK